MKLPNTSTRLVMTLPLLCATAFGLTACQKEAPPAPQPQETQAAPNPNPDPAPAPQPAATGNDLIRQAPAPTAPAIQAMQSKPYNETTVHLTKARVAGPILTVEFVFEPPRKPDGKYDYVNSYEAKFEELAYIDEASAQKVSILQDENGKYSGSPTLGSLGDTLYVSGSGNMTTVTLKYPAPPEQTQTISITLPKIGSFDGITITR